MYKLPASETSNLFKANPILNPLWHHSMPHYMAWWLIITD